MVKKKLESCNAGSFKQLSSLLSCFLLLLVLFLSVRPVSPMEEKGFIVERGANFERFIYLDGSSIVNVYPSLKFIEHDGEWVTHGFQVLEDHVQAFSPYIGVKVYEYYAEIWTPDFNEIRCYNERWVVETFQKGRWKDVGGWNPVLTVLNDSSGVKITRSMTCFDGQFNVTYNVQASSYLLTVLSFNFNSVYQVRVSRRMSGIAGDEIIYNNIDLNDLELRNASITSELSINPLSVVFKSESNSFLLGISLWNNVIFTFNESSGEILNVSSMVDSCIVDYHSFGHSKMDLTFYKNEWNLTDEGFIVDPTTVYASEDAYVWSGYPDLNYGSDNYLEIRNWSGTRHSYLKFDVSGVSSVSNVSLILYVQGYDEYGTTTIALNNVTDDSWTEGGITWNNKPSTGEEFEVKSIGGAVNSTHEWNSEALTSFVSNEVSGDDTVSLAITFKGGWGRQRYWSTEEDGKDPYLSITEGAGNNPPNAPILFSPSNTSRYCPSVNVTFYWNFSDPDEGDTQGAYEFDMDNDTDFSSPIIDGSKNSTSNQFHRQQLPAIVGLYYWRVRTWDDSDDVGAYNSSRQVVVTEINVNFTVNDSTPKNGQTVTFTVSLKHSYDNQTVVNYTYSVNRNSTIFKLNHGSPTFTDSNSSVSYVYDFINVSDLDYSLTCFNDPSDLTVTWTESMIPITFLTASTVTVLFIMAPIIFLIFLFAYKKR